VASAVIIIRSRSICDRPSDRIYPHSPLVQVFDAMWRPSSPSSPSSLNPILAGALRNSAKSSHLFYRVVAFTFHWNCNARSCPRYVKYSFHYWHWEIRRISAIQMGPNKKGKIFNQTKSSWLIWVGVEQVRCQCEFTEGNKSHVLIQPLGKIMRGSTQVDKTRHLILSSSYWTSTEPAHRLSSYFTQSFPQHSE
jgi:hypothetical protein